MSHEWEEEDYSFTDAVDHAILMHREVHFGGKFDFMIEYYSTSGKGVQPEFELSRIEELALAEKNQKENLAPKMLSAADAEHIARAKDAYKKLRSLYEGKIASNPAFKNARLIADLVLSEDPEATVESKAIVAEKGAIVPALLDLVRSEEFYDPLFPGYGLAPVLAAKCLGLIGDKRAIIALFELIGTGDFFNEDIILEALQHIGQPAKDFLLHVLHGQPLNYDNERAAVALIQFKMEPEVANACFDVFKTLNLKQHLSLGTYLVLCCEGLTDQKRREDFIKASKSSDTPKNLQQDMKTIAHTWS